MTDRPSWHRTQWGRLQERIKTGRLPHALLLHGPDGLGKRRFADRLARSLLCTSPDETGEPCDRCRACRMCSAGTHPDLRWVEPEETGKAIRIDAVRALCSDLALKSQFGSFKVAVVVPADRLNIAASNALLKTLEEPSPATLLTLVSSRPTYLPATIRSRCQSLAFVAPDRREALSWLQGHHLDDPETLLDMAYGAPFLAVQLGESDGIERRRQLLRAIDDLRRGGLDPVTTAANYVEQDVNGICRWMLSYVTDMIRLKFAANPPALSNADSREVLERMARSLTSSELFALQDALMAAQRLLDTSVNTQLLLEDLFMRWMPAPERAAAER